MCVCVCLCVCVGDSALLSLSYFFATPPLLSTLTGIVVSEDSRAGTIRGASTVRNPSGERLEVTFSMLAVEGRLEGEHVEFKSLDKKKIGLKKKKKKHHSHY